METLTQIEDANLGSQDDTNLLKGNDYYFDAALGSRYYVRFSSRAIIIALDHPDFHAGSALLIRVNADGSFGLPHSRLTLLQSEKYVRAFSYAIELFKTVQIVKPLGHEHRRFHVSMNHLRQLGLTMMARGDESA